METWNSIGEWAEETFPGGSPKSIVAHLCDETNNELRPAVEANLKKQERLEIADCIILLALLAYVDGIDIWPAVEEKMSINRSRKWSIEPTEKGFRKHIE